MLARRGGHTGVQQAAAAAAAAGAAQRAAAHRPNCVVASVQRLRRPPSSGSTLTLLIHGIHCGMRSRSSHSAQQTSRGTGTSTSARLSSHAAMRARPRLPLVTPGATAAPAKEVLPGVEGGVCVRVHGPNGRGPLVAASARLKRKARAASPAVARRTARASPPDAAAPPDACLRGVGSSSAAGRAPWRPIGCETLPGGRRSLPPWPSPPARPPAGRPRALGRALCAPCCSACCWWAAWAGRWREGADRALYLQRCRSYVSRGGGRLVGPPGRHGPCS